MTEYFICEHCATSYELDRATNDYSQRGIKIVTMEHMRDEAKCPLCGNPLMYASNHDIKFDICAYVDAKHKALRNLKNIERHIYQRHTNPGCTCKFICAECSNPHELGKCKGCTMYSIISEDNHDCNRCGACGGGCQKGDGEE